MALTITVRYFAAAREKAQRRDEQLSVPDGTTLGALLELVLERTPALVSLKAHLRLALDDEFAPLDTPLRDGVEVAVIPPVAGGAALPVLVEAPLTLTQVVEAVSGPGQGGVVTFSGVVRAQARGESVAHLEYEAHPSMVEKQVARIVEAARAQWPQVQLAVQHRVGRLEPGAVAVVIAASAPHRKEAFLACEFAIERLKHEVPIWKKETTTGGSVWVGLGP